MKRQYQLSVSFVGFLYKKKKISFLFSYSQILLHVTVRNLGKMGKGIKKRTKLSLCGEQK